MYRFLFIALAALMLAGCFRSEVREARRERAPLRDVFPPPSVEQAATPPGAVEAPTAADASATPEAEVAEAPVESPAAELRLETRGMADEFTEARPAIEEAQQAAADTAAQDVAAAVAAAEDGPGAEEAVAEEAAAASLEAPSLSSAPPDDEDSAVEEAESPSADIAAPDGASADAGASGTVIQPLPSADTRTPPRIVIATRPAILVPLYGKPRMVGVPGTALQRIENTPAIVLKGKSGNYYIPVYDGFVQSKRLDGNWTVTKPIPKVLLTGKADALKAGQQDLFAARANPRTGRTPSLAAGAPRVLVSSQPTALVIVEGQPGYQRVAGTELSRLVNSDAVMFRNAADDRLYLQVGENWYRAPSTSGPWETVAAGELPADIPAALRAGG